ncbi:hypothetical protein LB523_12285 [Mesorhizobium sp. ESP-6-4]|uniref:hypothetical protein n=1 Tax=Mesorhizobium sp. ESP-6-4 TaxID=2876624 RepID=UPI001CCE15D4|nr:hypothetical protein [Mesorhizobium sp. ESP-6-4]MBZ9659825.1 hypothetical protein [Mesorhizobium sp. ESP-6-4]
MSDATAKELAAILALCRGTAKTYRAIGKASPERVAEIADAIGDRIAALLERC